MSNARKTILIVEDLRIVAKDLQRMLTSLGYDVPRTAASAEAALQAAGEHPPDLILMDIRLHGGVDGIEAARLLRERFDVPIVYLTAHADDAIVSRARLTEPYGYLVKPVKPDELRSAIEVALYKHEMHARLELADRMASLGAMAAGVCHEINNPLTFVLGNLEIALHQVARCKDPGLRAELTRLLDTCLKGSQRVSQIVADLRTFSRPAAHGPGLVELREVLAWAVQVTTPTTRERARVINQVEPVPAVLADETRLGQVFVNLIINAAHAIPEGSPARNEIRLHAYTDETGWAVIDVSDTGSGMSPEVLRRIFEPFFTTKRTSAGTGLGLSICHGIVVSLGGEIQVTSSPERGSRFRVRLPPAPPGAGMSATKREPTNAAPREPSGRILVVDDEAFIRALSVDVLREDGHDVLECETAEEALTALRAGERPDVILTDLMMPGMDGVAFFETLTRDLPALAARTVFISGGACSTRTTEFLRTTSAPCLEKPFTAAQLREQVERVLRQRQVLDN